MTQPRIVWTRSLQAALQELRTAAAVALDHDMDRWQYAVAIRRQHERGASDFVMRCLIDRDLLAVAVERTGPKSRRRRFHQADTALSSEHACLVITDQGLARLPAATRRSRHVPKGYLVPHWDADNRVLWFRGRVVLEIGREAPSMEPALAAFEEQGWPRVIDNPLLPRDGINPRRQLIDTQKNLNRHMKVGYLRFHARGKDRKLLWKEK